jgi:uncharacterized protein YcaQ
LRASRRPRAERLTAGQARRLALAAQGLAGPRPEGRTDGRRLNQVLARTGLLQIDSVNVLARAHYLPLFSRLGPYPRELLERAAWGRPRRLFEYWAHVASLLPLEAHPLLRWRMARAEHGETWPGLSAFAGPRRTEADALLRRIEAEGPLAASDLQAPRGPGGWWGWSEAKSALEWLFWAGLITTATRRGSFERVYDLTERVIPRAILDLPTPEPADAQRELVRRAMGSLGVATATDLRDYYRLKPDDFRPRLAELIEAGEIAPVAVAGWGHAAFIDAAVTSIPRRVQGRALLAPFDPLVWFRERTERLFGLRYRIGIYTPAHKREHGYYVLPFLLRDTLAARVDLKADREAGVLRVQSAHGEPTAPADTAGELARELVAMAAWLGLERVAVAGPGDLAGALHGALSGQGA